MDRRLFVKPIAHRGFHNGTTLIENTAPAFKRGLELGYGLECDLQPASDGTPMVFHDDTVDRLTTARGRIDQMTPAALRKLAYKGYPHQHEAIISFAEFLELADGRGPLLVEIKTTWGPIPERFLTEIGRLASGYKGAIALMSFDPAALKPMVALAPHVPRGLVSGRYAGPGWWLEVLGLPRGEALTNLADSQDVQASFVAYHVKALPARPLEPLKRRGLPIFTWTVRTADDLAVARAHADAPIFEHVDPATGVLFAKS